MGNIFSPRYYFKQKLTNDLLAYFFIIFLIPLFYSNAYAAERIIIRVCLDEGVNQADFRVLSGNYQLIDGATGLVVAQPEANELWSVVKQGPVMRIRREGNALAHPYAGPILLLPGNSEELLCFAIETSATATH